MMVCKNLSSQRQTKCKDVDIHRKLRRNQFKAAEENQEYHMKTTNLRGKEEREELKENQTLMNSATLKEKLSKSVWDCGSPLYDSHELVSLDHLIDRHLMAFPSSPHYGSKPIITRFSHHSHILVSEVARKVGSPEKSNGSFMVTSLRNFLGKIRKRKDNKLERRKKNKEMRRGLDGFVFYLLCGGNKKHT